ncbi:MAG: hypothetical protein WCK90_05670 [archaeon]
MKEFDTFNAVFEKKPFRVYESEEMILSDYHVFGVHNKIPVSRLTVSVVSKTDDKYLNDFFFDLSHNPPIPRPHVFSQKTDIRHRGRGYAGRLIIIANEICKMRFGTPLASGTTFLNYPHNGNRNNLPAKRVWQKLEERGYAERRIYHGKDRWLMH